MSLPILGTWATEANYPSGSNPWNSQPTKVAPSPDYFSPNTKPPAQYFNYILNKVYAQDAAIESAGIAHALNHWSALTTATSLISTSTVVGAGWDAVNSRWLALLTSGGNNAFVYETLDTGRTWTQASSSTPGSAPTSIAVAAGACLIGVPNGGAVDALFVDATGTLHTAIVIESGTPSTAVWVSYLSSFTWWNAYSVNQTGGTFTGAFNLSGFTIPTTGDWGPFTSSLPAAWQSGTNHVGNVLFAQNSAGTIGLWAMCGATAGTDTAHLMTQTSGPTFTDVTPSLLAGSVITGMAYDATEGLFGFLAYTGASTYLFVSNNPSNVSSWVECGAWTGQAQGLAVVGSVWAVGLAYTLTPDSGARVQISSGVSAVFNGAGGLAPFSWTQCSLLDALPLTLSSSGNGLLVATAAKMECSQQYGLL